VQAGRRKKPVMGVKEDIEDFYDFWYYGGNVGIGIEV
jgi:hypothetical protein